MSDTVKWTDESTREFIQLRYKLRHLFNGRKHECAKAYRRIVEDLGLGDVVTATQARKKWSNLVQKYKDIKTGYSTSNVDWPYFQILDTIVPLMRKEAIELGSSINVDKVDSVLDNDAELKPGVTDPLSLDTSTYSNMSPVDVVEKCGSKPADDEPPLKKQKNKRRQAAQKARERWWGAVEDEEVCSDSGGSATRGDNVINHSNARSVVGKDLDPTEMEIQTFHMLKSCANSLVEIKEILKSQTELQNEVMKKLTHAVEQQGEALKNVLFTISGQNSAFISLTSRLTADGIQSTTGLSNDRTFEPKSSPGSEAHPHQDNQLLTSQQNLINALSHESQHCDTSLVDNSELSDSISGL